MDNTELLDNILGFKLYDDGFTDAGIKNNDLKEKCKILSHQRVKEMDKIFMDYIHDMTSQDIYSTEDIYLFLRYLIEEFDWNM